MQISIETSERKSSPPENNINQFLKKPESSSLLCQSREEFNLFLKELGESSVTMLDPEDFTGRSSRGHIHSQYGTFIFDSREDYDNHIETTTIKFVS